MRRNRFTGFFAGLLYLGVPLLALGSLFTWNASDNVAGSTSEFVEVAIASEGFADPANREIDGLGNWAYTSKNSVGATMSERSPTRLHFNQGIGNGPEGGDPGNSHPHGGSNDEGGRNPGDPITPRNKRNR